MSDAYQLWYNNCIEVSWLEKGSDNGDGLGRFFKIYSLLHAVLFLKFEKNVVYVVFWEKVYIDLLMLKNRGDLLFVDVFF